MEEPKYNELTTCESMAMKPHHIFLSKIYQKSACAIL